MTSPDAATQRTTQSDRVEQSSSCPACGNGGCFVVNPFLFEPRPNVVGGQAFALQVIARKGGHFRLSICDACGYVQWFAVDAAETLVRNVGHGGV